MMVNTTFQSILNNCILYQILSYPKNKIIKIATTIPKIAVPSARAQPSNNALVIFPSASGCLAIASVAFDVAIPIPTPAPIPVNV